MQQYGVPRVVRRRTAAPGSARGKVAPRMSTSPPASLPKLPQDVRIGFLVHDVSRMRRTLFDQAMKPLGITRSQWWVLSQLSRHARDGMPQTDLARDLDVGKVTVGGLIDRLEAAGHVVRQPDAVDRRAKRIVVTEDGRRVLKQMVAVGQSLNQIILAGLSPEGIEVTERALSVMKDNIRQGTADRDDADLAVGVFGPGDEAAEAPPPRKAAQRL